MRLQFQLEKVDASPSRARAGNFRTLHGHVLTPTFMPVGTQATVRGQHFGVLEDCGAQVLLANTYHLLLRPGADLFRKLGGIHRFMNWKGSVLTDSGGFQAFSLSKSLTISEKGVGFDGYLGSRAVMLTPELSIETQKAIGSDIMMVLDHCIPSTSDKATTEAAMHRTFRWAKRSLEARGDSPQALFGIVQGACYPDLRKLSAEQITSLPLDGFAIGGLAVGEPREQREAMTGCTTDLMPAHLPRYLMGVGTPIDLLEAVYRGVDMFDCILPTAVAQNGAAYTWNGRIDLRRGAYRESELPLDKDCPCPTCRRHSRAYLHHLLKAREFLGWQLVGTHNTYFYQILMTSLREAILAGTFSTLYEKLRVTLPQNDEDCPVTPPLRLRQKRKSATEMGVYEIHHSPQGFASIKHRSGEIMHSVSDPITEANRLYVEQSDLAQKIAAVSNEPLVIWDVGLGAATNAMATINKIESVSTPIRPVHLMSFENDLDSLRLALANLDHFRYLRHPAPHRLMHEGYWNSATQPLRWTLIDGDFLEKLEEAPVPDLIFFDPFSYKTDSPLWTLSCFKKIFERCRYQATELYTYSASTAARAALLAAGFYVARGAGTGPKNETTIALTGSAQENSGHSLLGEEWLSRWERSDAKFPSSIKASERAAFEKSIRRHRQFRQQSRSGNQRVDFLESRLSTGGSTRPPESERGSEASNDGLFV